MTADRDPLLGTAAWNRQWSALGADAVPVDVHAQLLERYAEPHRAYHTQQHLRECLALRAELEGCCSAPAEVDVALWFHDAIYEPARDDNEERSAQWLDDVARQAGLDRALRDRLRALVLVTRHAESPCTADEAVLVDIDLAILGAAPERFAEYEAQVRQEYAWVPEALYRRKRREILTGFLDRSAIYATAACQRRFETQAQENLRRSIAALA